jgi:hypothetical protein
MVTTYAHILKTDILQIHSWIIFENFLNPCVKEIFVTWEPMPSNFWALLPINFSSTIQDKALSSDFTNRYSKRKIIK